MNKIIRLAVSLVFIFALSCNLAKKNDDIYRENRILMGTLVSISISSLKDGQAREMVSRAFELMGKLEKTLSVDSDALKLLEQKAGSGEFTTLPPEVFYVIKEGIRYGGLSRGKFDVTVFPLTRLWGFSDEDEKKDIPTPEAIKKVLPLIDYRKIICRNENQVYIEQNGMKIDLGGLAKGYIVDMASRFLRENGVDDFIIDAGGDMAVHGKKNGKANWKIGIQNPWDKNGIEAVMELSDMAVATSGDYERFIVKDGVRYHHILDPHTGYPTGKITSVTVTADTTLKADVLATSAFLMGPSDGLALLEKLDGVEGIIITKEKEVMKTSGIGSKINFSPGRGM